MIFKLNLELNPTKLIGFISQLKYKSHFFCNSNNSYFLSTPSLTNYCSYFACILLSFQQNCCKERKASDFRRDCCDTSPDLLEATINFAAFQSQYNKTMSGPNFEPSLYSCKNTSRETDEE